MTATISLPRRLLEELTAERLTAMQFMVLTLLCATTDPATGVCLASDESLTALSGNQLNYGRVAEAMEALTAGGYLKKVYIPRRRKLYTMCLDGYLITSGPNAGQQVSVALTINPDNPAPVPASETATQQ